mmetsp:Transcript_1238/g.3185  ORF Transcript_1238/g.3185 Transcript_1238/m.3185 type:complete len:761 (+) Transcript_1238:1-2283(+)
MTSLPNSAQVTSECFMSEDKVANQEQRLAGSVEDEFRSTGVSSSQGCTPRDARWRDMTLKEGLNTARSLRRAVEQQFKAKPAPATKDWAGTGVAQKLQMRVAASESLAHLLRQRIEGTELSLRKVNESLSQLTREEELLRTPADLCARRLLLRSQRPEDFKVEDEFQLALEHEEHVLSSSNQHLSMYQDAGEKLQSTLMAAKEELVEDLQFKRYALRLEKSALQFDPYHGRDRACVLPMVAEGTKSGSKRQAIAVDCDVQSGYDMPPFKFGTTHKSLDRRDEWSEETAENIHRSVKHTQELLSRTEELEGNAGQFLESAADLASRMKQQTRHARENSHSCMKASISDLAQRKRELEEGVAQGQVDINRTEALLQHMQREINSQKTFLEDWEETPEIPLEKFDQRLPLAIQQDMRTSATDRMQEHVHNSRNNVHNLSNKCEELKELLSHLRNSHESLQNSLSGVTASWTIDMQCAKLRAMSKEVSQSTFVVSKSQATTVVPVAGRLSRDALDMIRSKIKSAAYMGPNQQGFDGIFNRFDKDGSGTLCFDEIRGALRRILRIPKSSVSDSQISSLCVLLDTNGSGNIDIAELVAFIGEESLEGRKGSLKQKLNHNLGLSQVDGSAFHLDCFVNRKEPPQRQDRRCHASPKEHCKMPPLSQSVLDTFRSKIKAAAYAGQLGREVQALFSRFDQNGSGVLEVDEVRQVIRRAMRVPPTVITDQQILKLCSMLDEDQSGAISIAELTKFVGREPEISKRTGRKLY